MAAVRDHDAEDEDEADAAGGGRSRRRERFNHEFDLVLLRAVVAHRPFAAPRGRVTGEWERVATHVNASLAKAFTPRACRDRVTVLRAWGDARGPRVRASAGGGVTGVLREKLALLQQVAQLRAAAREHKRLRHARRGSSGEDVVLPVERELAAAQSVAVAVAGAVDGERVQESGTGVETRNRKRPRDDESRVQAARGATSGEEMALRREEMALRREELQEQRAAREQQAALLQQQMQQSREQMQQSREQMQQSAAHTDALIRLLTAALDRGA